MKRRDLISKAVNIALFSMTSEVLSASAIQRVSFVDYPFKLGVASGDPSTDGFVIWTRLVPVPMDAKATPQIPIIVEWIVAIDKECESIVRRGSVVAYPHNAHSVHVEVNGLKPNTEHFYFFKVPNHKSTTGRVFTSPQVGNRTDNYLFALASCQSFTDGHYAAYKDMLEKDPKLVIHTGDYVYEQDWVGGVRSIPISEAHTLNDYRMLYARYKEDSSLQAIHANSAWLAIWDDHEVDNDWGGDYSTENLSVEQFVKRKTAAFKAYFEHMPLRLAAKPQNGKVHLYQRTVIGDLIQFDMLDCRQFRDLPVCTNDKKLIRNYKAMCEDAMRSDRSFLGKRQEDWLLRGFGQHGTKWNALIQTTIFAPFDFLSGEKRAYDMDGWDNYSATRQRILDTVAEQEVENPIVFGGNIHAFYAGVVNEIATDPSSVPLMTEIVSSSITSGGGGDVRYAKTKAQFVENSFARYFENRKRGYLLCHVNKQRLSVDLRAVDNPLDPNSLSTTLKTLVVKSGIVEVEVR